MKKQWKRQLNLGIYAIVWSFVIGVATASYLNFINWLIELVWHSYLHGDNAFGRWYPFLVCGLGGGLVGWLNCHWGNYPWTIEQVLSKVRLHGELDYHQWWKSLVLGLLVLGLGGSVGPEASTAVLTGSMINWLGDRLRWEKSSSSVQPARNLWSGRMDPVQLKQAPRFSALFHSKAERLATVTALTIVGVVGASIIFKLFPEEGAFGIHHQAIQWAPANLWTWLPAMVVGIAFGCFFVYLENSFAKLINIRLGPIMQGIIFGLTLALASLVSPDVMFSGEFRIVPFSNEALNLSVAFLILLALLKAVLTNLGFVMGWRGGTIFPAIFSSVAVGVACAMLLPGNLRVNAIVVVTASLTRILGKPILVIVLLFFLVAVELSPVIIVIALLVSGLLKLPAVINN